MTQPGPHQPHTFPSPPLLPCAGHAHMAGSSGMLEAYVVSQRLSLPCRAVAMPPPDVSTTPPAAPTLPNLPCMGIRVGGTLSSAAPSPSSLYVACLSSSADARVTLPLSPPHAGAWHAHQARRARRRSNQVPVRGQSTVRAPVSPMSALSTRFSVFRRRLSEVGNTYGCPLVCKSG